MKAIVKVVGMVAGERQHVVSQVSEGDPVLLLPEPTNQFDPQAVAVFTAPAGAILMGIDSPSDRALLLDRQAGYLPRDVAARLSVSMPASGVAATIHAVRYHPSGHPDHHVPAGFDVLVEVPR